MKQMFLLLALVLAVPFGVAAQVGGVSIELSVEQKHYLPDEDVFVTLKILNRSGQTLDFGKDAEWMTFSIQADNNTVVEKLGGVPQGGEFSLVSGQFGSKRVNLAPYFSFHNVGQYRVIATVKISQWTEKVTSAPATFVVMNGVIVPGLPELTFGMPPAAGQTNAVPEVRKYVILKTENLDEQVLYFRLTDAAGSKTLRTYPLGRVVSFAKPEAQVDRDSNLHLLFQEGAKSFCYFVITPEGRMVVRQAHEFAQSRPALRADSEGRIYVAGGARRYTMADLPAPVSEGIPIISTNSNATSQ